jgi:predicted SprT family Zn-dependent metalloprotease
MKKKIRILLLAASFTCAALLAYLFLWGKLFPFSPVAIGFAKHDMPHMLIYVQEGAEFNDFARLDDLVPGVENFHELRFTHKPRLYIFRDRASYAHRSVSNARFCAFPNGNIVISPWAVQEAKEGKISLEIYLKHELSHSLLFQNAGIWRAYKYPDWLLEGIAVYSANQMGTSWYPSKKETYGRMKRGNFMPPKYYKTRKEDGVRLDVPYRMGFIYSEFGCIVDDLIETFGRDKFLRYMKRLCLTSDSEGLFNDIFGISLDTFIDHFREQVSSSSIPNQEGREVSAAGRRSPLFIGVSDFPN